MECRYAAIAVYRVATAISSPSLKLVSDTLKISQSTATGLMTGARDAGLAPEVRIQEARWAPAVDPYNDPSRRHVGPSGRRAGVRRSVYDQRDAQGVGSGVAIDEFVEGEEFHRPVGSAGYLRPDSLTFASHDRGIRSCSRRQFRQSTDHASVDLPMLIADLPMLCALRLSVRRCGLR